jgi:WD40 repeat protein
MSRSLILTAVLAALGLAMPAARGQNVRTLDPALTIRVARSEQAVNDPATPGSVVSGMALSPDGRTLAAVGDDHVVRTFSLPDGRRLHELAGHQRWVRGAAFSGDGQSLVTADEERRIIFWDIVARKSKQELNAGVQVYGLAMSPSADQFAVVGFGEQVRLIGATGQAGSELPAPGRDTRAVAFSADGQWLAAVAHNGKLSVWHLPQTTPVIDGLPADRRALYAVAFSPDGQWVAAGGDSEVIGIWNAQTGKKRLAIRRSGKTRSLAFCGPDLLAAGGTDNRIRIWDLARVEKLPPGNEVHVEDTQLVGHQGSVTALIYDAREGRMISGSYDTTIRVWNLKPGTPRTTSAEEGKIR